MRCLEIITNSVSTDRFAVPDTPDPTDHSDSPLDGLTHAYPTTFSLPLLAR